jgi:hypothetical protein
VMQRKVLATAALGNMQPSLALLAGKPRHMDGTAQAAVPQMCHCLA